MHWHSDVGAAGSRELLRANLLAHNPAFDPAHLRRIAIVGAAGEGERLAKICQHRGIGVAAIADDDPSKVGHAIGAQQVVRTADLARLDRATPIVIASHRVLRAAQMLHAQGFASVAPFAVLQVLAPEQFPPHMFYDGLLTDTAENIEQYRWLERELADDFSRRVLDAVLGFRQTLDARLLAPVLEEDLYNPADLLSYADDEVYVDGGSYDGDTLKLFIARVGGRFDRIYAFEPDPLTFARLQRNFAAEPRVEAINAGLHSTKGKLRFRNDASRGAIFTPDGDCEIAVTTIDDTVGDGRVTYIKLNIEGAELDALQGASRTIRRWLPKLAISAYHRPSDLWKVPKLVRELSDSYDLYLRQHDGGVIETVLYALPRQDGRTRNPEKSA
jgi:FkbM family methyltransferase